MVGKREKTAKQTFDQWCKEHGFDMDRRVRADAIWLAENFSVLSNRWTSDLTHPTRIRAWAQEIQAETPPAPEVDLSTSPAPRQRLTIETAKKVNKLASMAEGGEGQEQETAKKYLKKQAELPASGHPQSDFLHFLFWSA